MPGTPDQRPFVPEGPLSDKLQAQTAFFESAYWIQREGSSPEAEEEFDRALDGLVRLFPKLNLDGLQQLREESPAAKVVTTISVTERGASAVAEYLDAVDQLGLNQTEKAILDFGREHYPWELREREIE